jgi:hypothetical protein
MTAAASTVKKGSGKSPACPIVLMTSSSETLVSANWRVVKKRGISDRMLSCIDIFRGLLEEHLERRDIGEIKESTPMLRKVRTIEQIATAVEKDLMVLSDVTLETTYET